MIHRKGEFFTLAVSDSKATIDAHWRYLTQDLTPLLQTIDDVEDRKEFIVAKVSGLAALEGEIQSFFFHLFTIHRRRRRKR